MLGALFRIGEQLGGVAFVFFRRLSPTSSTGDRSNFNQVVRDADVQFRRASDERERIAKAQAKHVGRWVHQTQATIKFKWVATKIRLEALREHDLERVSGTNVFLCFQNGSFEFLLSGVAACRESGYAHLCINQRQMRCAG